MKRLTFGERHAGTHTTVGRLGGLCRAAGRLEVGERLQGQTVAGGRSRGGGYVEGEREGGGWDQSLLVELSSRTILNVFCHSYKFWA